VAKTIDHVTVDVPGLSVLFEQSVGNVAATFSNPLQLGHSTAVVAALDAGHVDVKQNPNGSVTVDSTPSTSAPASGPPTTKVVGGNSTSTGRGPQSNGSGGPKSPPVSGNSNAAQPSTGNGTASNNTPPAPNVGEPATAQPANPASGQVSTDPGLNNPGETALPSPREVLDNLKGAHTVSGAFGAFLGLGLILPLARFLIRRLG
jgi:hypothetical protein